jgi:hypothetical protein
MPGAREEVLKLAESRWRTDHQASSRQTCPARRQTVHNRLHRPARAAPSQDAMRDCATLIITGSSFP